MKFIYKESLSPIILLLYKRGSITVRVPTNNY